jgi:excinuclease ABC subunit A
MDFLADVWVTCEVCGGARFAKDTLEVRWKGKNVAELLNMEIGEARELFAEAPDIARKLETLCDVGLDYLHLGQPSPTLSGGEAQRVKLSRELAKRSTGKTLYILDEPTTGLHMADVRQLITVLERLVDAGNTGRRGAPAAARSSSRARRSRWRSASGRRRARRFCRC